MNVICIFLLKYVNKIIFLDIYSLKTDVRILYFMFKWENHNYARFLHAYIGVMQMYSYSFGQNEFTTKRFFLLNATV